MEMVIMATKAITTSLIMATSHIKVIKGITTIAGRPGGTTYGIDMKLAPGLTFSPECGVDSGNPNCHVTGMFVTRDDSAFFYQNIKDFCAPIKHCS
jgi:hypothetical protein